ncbi:MAG: transcription repressor NadR [Bacillota bacterium]|nr:transcription repressor NadR [Bacillota bacterium]
MKGEERRALIIDRLKNAPSPIAGKDLAKEFKVSRQVIVQDIALLRAQKYDLISTNHGYILNAIQKVSRVFKVKHNDEQTKEEMRLIVDFGGCVEDVFVYHRMYDVIRVELNIRSRNDIDVFLEGIRTGSSSLLKNITDGYHYHTVSAPTDVILDLIKKQLDEHGFLASLQDFEPVDIQQ